MDQSSKPRPSEDNDDNDDDDDDEDQKARPEQLLEDSWFFHNSLHRKLTISTNSHDPLPMNSTKSYEETYQSIKKVSQRDESGPSTCLTRRPSLPLCPQRKGSNLMPKGGSDVERRKSESGTTSSEESARAPTTMGMSVGDEEIQDEEIEFSMGKLIRQASLTSSDFMLPANHSPKGMTAMSGCTSPRKMEFSKLKLERLRPRRQMNQLKSQKSLSDLQSKELQGFKDLGFDLGEKNLKQQELKRIEEDEERNTRRPPHPSEAQDSAPTTTESKWGVVKRSREDDMKAQIKFWARAVASNMRQD